MVNHVLFDFISDFSIKIIYIKLCFYVNYNLQLFFMKKNMMSLFVYNVKFSFLKLLVLGEIILSASVILLSGKNALISKIFWYFPL
ncbi:hypothetical protein SAMN05421593_1393 [Chryseobacterium culicis]|uniref:Uncharacterized protein n=1 Tax=Chryseobacterium culicis TaxID=680127 RepID=A0A1H6H510_CHRCI|nr:hypothetical protein SAMN05421593_1393 [Chryseobacterium culicis]